MSAAWLLALGGHGRFDVAPEALVVHVVRAHRRGGQEQLRADITVSMRAGDQRAPSCSSLRFDDLASQLLLDEVSGDHTEVGDGLARGLVGVASADGVERLQTGIDAGQEDVAVFATRTSLSSSLSTWRVPGVYTQSEWM